MLDDRYYMRSSPFSSRRSVTVWLLIINVVALILQLSLERFTSLDLSRFFELSLEGLRRGYLWQLITFQFMHSGWMHLVVNCLIIYGFGRELEEQLGKKTFATLYLTCGIAGGLLQVVLGLVFGGPFAAPTVGASAGALGLIAAFATLHPERPLTILLFFILPVSMRAKFLLFWAGTATLIGLLTVGGNIAHGAHAGGLLWGIIFVRWAIHWDFKLPALRPVAGPRRPLRTASKAKPTPWGGPSQDAEELPAGEFLSKKVDPILDKISAQGIQSLTERERRILERARARMVKR